MKKYIYVLCAVLMGVFASCSKSEMEGETPQSNQVTLKVATDEGLQTRGIDIKVDRYAIEVYTDANYIIPANEVFGNSNNKSTSTTGVFAMTLDRTQTYYCLLWADKNGEAAYNIADLKAVTLTGKAAEAWHGTTIIAAGTTAALTATLTRAVSKIQLKESGKLEAPATLKLNFNQPTVFNVQTKKTSAPSAPSARPEETISILKNVDGTTTPAVLNPNNDIFVLSSVATADLTDLTFQYNEETTFIVTQAPLKANFITNIIGHYTSAKSTTFTVTADGEWEKPDKEAGFAKAKVGDFYYEDKTFSSTYIDNAQNPCIGIVFVVNADGYTGKIVGLTEPEVNWNSTGNKFKGMLTWAQVDDKTNATDKKNGAMNMATIKCFDPTLNSYPAFDWVDSQNTPATASIRNWYLPAREELRQLYAAMSGLKWVASGAGVGEINDWGFQAGGMPDNANYAAARTAFNEKFTIAKGTAMFLDWPYWSSSTMLYNKSDLPLYVSFKNGNTTTGEKLLALHIRAVSVF